MKRGIALILSLLISISSVPLTAFASEESGGTTEPVSLLPIQEYEVSVTLSYYFDGELAEYPISVFIDAVQEQMRQKYNISLNNSDYHYWTRSTGRTGIDSSNNHELFGNMNKIESGGFIDLQPKYKSLYSDKTVNIQLIAGEDDQLNLDNKRIIVHTKLENKDIRFKFFDYMIGADGQTQVQLPLVNTTYSLSSYFRLSLSEQVDNYIEGTNSYLSMSFDTSTSDGAQAAKDLTVRIYHGVFDSIDMLNKAVQDGTAEEITGQMWKQTEAGRADGYLYDYTKQTSRPQFTMTINHGEKLIEFEIFNISLSAPYIRVEFNSLKTDNGVTLLGEERQNGDDAYTVYVEPRAETYNIKRYRVLLNAWLSSDSDQTNNSSLIKAAYAGTYDSEDRIPADAENIKDQLFSTDGYLIEDITPGANFTIITTGGRIYKYQIQLLDPQVYVRFVRLTSEDETITADAADVNKFGVEISVDADDVRNPKKYSVQLEASLSSDFTDSSVAVDDIVAAAYEGTYSSLDEIPEELTNIRDQLFSQNGYFTDAYFALTGGYRFTIFTTTGEAIHYNIYAMAPTIFVEFYSLTPEGSENSFYDYSSVEDENDDNYGAVVVNVDRNTFESTDRYYVRLKANWLYGDATDLITAAYEGSYGWEEPTNVPNIKDQLFSDKGCPVDNLKSGVDFTFYTVFNSYNVTMPYTPVCRIVVSPPIESQVTAEFKYLIPNDNNAERIANKISENNTNGLKVITVQPTESQSLAYKKSMAYNVVFSAATSEPNVGLDVNFISAAYEGDYRSKGDIPSSAENIKEKLFSESGYLIKDFTNGAYFTIVTSDDKILNYLILFDEINQQLVAPPTPASEDTYFHVDSVDGKEYYILPFEDDTYYYNGFQTIFLKETDGDSIEEGEEIVPIFRQGNGVNVYASVSEKDPDSDYINTSSAYLQKSGVSKVKFQNGQAVFYSASSESGNRLKNYWVTFLTPQDEPTLYVNGINSNPDTTKIPEREIFLTDEYDFHHDILIANIGKEELKNISVELTSDAQHVKLDPYWTVNPSGGKALSGFNEFTNTTDPNKENYTEYGQQKFLAKIRLLPVGEGDISGTLIIKAGGDEGRQEQEYRIKLTGTAVTPRITTTKIIEGVLYVPYYSLIQTNNMHGGNTASNIVFSIVGGRLPNGMDMFPNGELYGTPTETGDFTFTVAAKSSDETVTYDTKQFTLHIATNDDEAVWNYDKLYGGDSNYKITIAIPNQDNVTISGGNFSNEAVIDDFDWSSENRIMETEGEYDYFETLWLDGVKLEPVKDYTAAPGSTRLTIMTQTLTGRSNGTHTLAAEFRDRTTGTVRRAAQNYKLETLGTGSQRPAGGNSGGGWSSSGSGSSSTPKPPATKSITPAETVNGSINASATKAKKGATVTVTATPDEGYEVGEVTVTDAKGNSIPVTKTGNNTYTFTMPNSEVSINATFTRLLPDPSTGLPFYDVRPNDWFLPYIQEVYKKGLMIGTSADTFKPLDDTQRAMIVTVLHRIAGNPEAEDTYFTDVPADAYYAQAVNWAAENGIISGYGDGIFGPEDDLSREQIVSVLMAYAEYASLDTDANASLDQFADSGETSDFAQKGMAWAVGEGLIQGKGNGTLDPKGTATRSEVAALLVRFSEWAESQDREPAPETDPKPETAPDEETDADDESGKVTEDEPDTDSDAGDKTEAEN